LFVKAKSSASKFEIKFLWEKEENQRQIFLEKPDDWQHKKVFFTDTIFATKFAKLKSEKGGNL